MFLELPVWPVCLPAKKNCADRVRPAQFKLCRAFLVQRGSGFTLNQRGIDRVDETLDVHVLPEVRVRYRDSGLRLGLAGIDGIAEAVGVCVSYQDSHRQ